MTNYQMRSKVEVRLPGVPVTTFGTIVEGPQIIDGKTFFKVELPDGDNWIRTDWMRAINLAV